ncbi:MAG: Maf family protein [Tumebacillaceae bacterium]
MQNNRLVLASGSPRRKELLALLGLSFDILVSDADETILPGTNPQQAVQELAYRKASAVANTLDGSEPGRVVLGADTIVVVDGEILGKPADRDDAARMLRLLSGRAHAVYTGIALVETGGGRVVRDVRGTEVVMKELRDEQIQAYISTGEPMDKAGAYAIQGKAVQFITEIHGDYTNVVGLPVSMTADRLAEFGFDVRPR